MKKILSYLVIMALPMLLFSCKKCFECKKPQYCLTCITTVGEFAAPVNDCYDSEEERTTARETIESGAELLGGEAICLESQGDDGSVTFCENKKNRDAELEQWKALGYTCTEE